MRLSRRGVRVDLPAGWEGSIWTEPRGLRAQGGVPEDAELSLAHLANFGLPRNRGDFGSGAVDVMLTNGVFVALLEYEPASAGTRLFARRGLPRRLVPGDFSPATLQRTLPGQAGTQIFFQEAGRAFCLYVVLGDATRAVRLVPRVNAVLDGVTIGDDQPSPPLRARSGRCRRRGADPD